MPDELLEQLLADLRATGRKRPLADYLSEQLVKPMLQKDWVQRMRPGPQDEYASQLYSDLDRIVNRLRDNDAPANRVLQICRAEFAHTRKHMYALRYQGDRGHKKIPAVPKSGGGRDRNTQDEQVRPIPIYDDPTIRDMHPCRQPSTHVPSRSSEAAQAWEELREDIETLGPFCHDDHERERWLQLWLWLDRYLQAQIRYVDAVALISTLQQRRNTRRAS